MSLKQLLRATILDLGLALLIALTLTVLVYANGFPYQPARDLNYCAGMNSLGVPLTAPGLRDTFDRASNTWGYDLVLDCRAAPADDQALADWLRSNAQFDLDKVQRLPSERYPGPSAAMIWVSLNGPQAREMPEVPWEKLGYQRSESDPTYWRSHAPFIVDGPPRAVLIDISLGFLQLGLFLVGLVRCWRNRRLGPEPMPRGESQSLPAALGVAAGLIGLTWLYVQALRSLFGPTAGLPEYLRVIPSVGWFMHLPNQGVMMTVQPPFVQLAIGVIAVLGAPLAQALFFRGGLLGTWMAANRFRTGAVVTAVAGALFARDWACFPVFVVVGLSLAWLYHWSRSLLASLLANIVFSAGLLCMVYGLIPSLPRPVDQLCGQWAGAVLPNEGRNPAGFRAVAPPNIEFLRGGMIKGGRTQSLYGQPSVTLEPRWYEWVDAEHIDVRWERTVREGSRMTVTLEVVRYRVAADWRELTLTREPGAEVLYYRRAP